MKIAQIAPYMESVPRRLYGGTERIISYLSDGLVRRLTFALCVLLIIVAVAFVWAKAGGQTDVSIFGITFSSASVGAFAIFCVLAMIVLNFRRILTSVERTK